MDSKRTKYGVLLAIIAGAGLALLAATQTWYTVQLTADADHPGGIAVAGSMAAPALTALAIAGLALAVALAIAGRVSRIILAVLGLLVGGSIVYSSVSAMGNPAGTAIATVTKTTGIAGTVSVTHLIGSIDAGIWPVVALIGGIVILLATIAVFATGQRWPSGSRRYDAVRFTDASDTAGSDGIDSDGSGDVHSSDGADGNSADRDNTDRHSVDGGGGNPARPPAENPRDAAIDSWDDLSRGEDPTR